MKRSYFTLFIFACIALLSSCSKEEVMDIPSSEAGLYFNISVADTKELRAESDNPENTIKSFWIFIENSEGTGFIVSTQCQKFGETGSKYFVPLEESVKDKLTRNLKTFIVANHNFGTSVPQNKTELKKVLISNMDLNTKTLESIPMVGEKDITYNYPTQKEYGTIDLTRRMLKVRVMKPTISIKDNDHTYTIKSVKAALVNYANAGYLYNNENGSDKLVSTEAFKEIVAKENTPEGSAYCEFYAFYQNWSQDENKAPAIRLDVTVQDQNNKEVTLKYKAAITPPQKQLLPNYIYQIKYNITAANPVEDKVEEITPESSSFEIKNWEYESVPYDIQNARFLFFFDHDIKIYKENQEITVGYATSSKIIREPEISCEYITINPDDFSVKKEGTLSINEKDNPQSPIIDIDKKKASVKINLKEIKGCYEKVLKIKLTNEQNQTDELIITQYPEALYSRWNVREKNNDGKSVGHLRIFNERSNTIEVERKEYTYFIGFPSWFKTHAYSFGDQKQKDEKDYFMTDYREYNQSLVSPSFYIFNPKDNNLYKDKPFLCTGLVNQYKAYVGQSGKGGEGYAIPKSTDQLFLMHYTAGSMNESYAVWIGMNLWRSAEGMVVGSETANYDNYPNRHITKLVNGTKEEVLINESWRLPTVAELLFIGKCMLSQAAAKTDRNIQDAIFDNQINGGPYWTANGLIVNFKTENNKLIGITIVDPRIKFQTYLRDNPNSIYAKAYADFYDYVIPKTVRASVLLIKDDNDF